ncbi:MAG: hypothetical protein ACK4PH_07515 [Aquincola tertiaricarbonis]|uniref:hypothetical protein n=1 Tax=Aquincola tertiaricarbonis TaxID=391953 RepID=UPI0012EE7F4D|nr:hypothetical protein [Aquincola tertiaricarbonis]
MPTRIANRREAVRSPWGRPLASPAAWFTLAALTALPAASRAADDVGASGASSVAMASLLGRVTAATPALREGGPPALDAALGTVSPADPVADAQGHVMDALSRVTVSRWMGRGQARLGLGVGAVGQRAADGVVLANPSPAVTVGVQLDLAPRATMYADASSAAVWRTAGSEAGAPAAFYNTRVGMEFKSASNARGLGFDRGAIGMQLDSGYRLQMKPRRGGLAVYLRGQF